MLVLTRKTHEKIQIGSDITVTIVRVKGGAVSVGVEAPVHIVVLRDELVQRDATAAQSRPRATAPGGRRLAPTAKDEVEGKLSSDEPGPCGRSCLAGGAPLQGMVQRRRVPSADAASTMSHQEHSGAASPHFDVPEPVNMTGLLLG